MCILKVVKTRRSITMSEEEVMGGGYHPPLSSYEPTNCDNKGKIPPSEAPYKKAREFISKDKERRCCNISKRDKSVQKWQLPHDKHKVHIRKVADSGTTLYYHDDLLGSEDFPH